MGRHGNELLQRAVLGQSFVALDLAAAAAAASKANKNSGTLIIWELPSTTVLFAIMAPMAIDVQFKTVT